MPDNAEIVRRVLAAWGEGDIETIVALMAPDCELIPLRAQLEGISYSGHEGVRRFWEDLNADWDDLELPAEEILDAGDRVVVLGRLVARGHTSGVDLDVPIGQIWELREGKIVRLQAFSDPDEALRAAGLDE